MHEMLMKRGRRPVDMIEVWPHSNIREVKVTSPDYAQCDEDKGKRLTLVPFPL